MDNDFLYGREMLRISEVAERLGVSTITVEQWCKKGIIPHYHAVGMMRSFDWIQVASWWETMRKGPPTTVDLPTPTYTRVYRPRPEDLIPGATLYTERRPLPVPQKPPSRPSPIQHLPFTPKVMLIQAYGRDKVYAIVYAMEDLGEEITMESLTARLQAKAD